MTMHQKNCTPREKGARETAYAIGEGIGVCRVVMVTAHYSSLNVDCGLEFTDVGLQHVVVF